MKSIEQVVEEMSVLLVDVKRELNRQLEDPEVHNYARVLELRMSDYIADKLFGERGVDTADPDILLYVVFGEQMYQNLRTYVMHETSIIMGEMQFVQVAAGMAKLHTETLLHMMVDLLIEAFRFRDSFDFNRVVLN